MNMLDDIFMAFAIAFVINFFGLYSKKFKSLIIFLISVTLIASYFINGPLKGPAMSLSFDIWILFVIFFNGVIEFIDWLFSIK